ncbi:hypothetical protein [Kitasatospora sp. NPDC050463]|uniref:hypothetical protein n=1 Tax=Kitasatospora sp. NPDC050463 TaxID=3155786 RepID=UPI0033FF1B38
MIRLVGEGTSTAAPVAQLGGSRETAGVLRGFLVEGPSAAEPEVQEAWMLETASEIRGGWGPAADLPAAREAGTFDWDEAEPGEDLSGTEPEVDFPASGPQEILTVRRNVARFFSGRGVDATDLFDPGDRECAAAPRRARIGGPLLGLASRTLPADVREEWLEEHHGYLLETEGWWRRLGMVLSELRGIPAMVHTVRRGRRESA